VGGTDKPLGMWEETKELLDFCLYFFPHSAFMQRPNSKALLINVSECATFSPFFGLTRVAADQWSGLSHLGGDMCMIHLKAVTADITLESPSPLPSHRQPERISFSC
jgi:hypothetical protein